MSVRDRSATHGPSTQRWVSHRRGRCDGGPATADTRFGAPAVAPPPFRAWFRWTTHRRPAGRG